MRNKKKVSIGYQEDISNYRGRNFPSLKMMVTDEGFGIEKEELTAIFEKFKRGSDVKDKVVGTGLGLAICKSIVEAHRGRIWAESIRSGGSMFCFVLPMVDLDCEMES